VGGLHGACLVSFVLGPALFAYLFAPQQPAGQSKPIPGLPAQARYDVQGEITFIGQTLLPFPAKYSGPSSLPSSGLTTATETATLYLGARVLPNVEAYINPEIDWGTAPGAGLGLGAGLNGDLNGQPELSAAPDLARAFVRWRIPMRQGKDEPVGREEVGRAPNIISGPVPQHRLVVTAGKFGVSDVFDYNSYANNPRGQFINFAFVNGLAYDFAQDQRGFNYGASVALVNPNYAVRAGSFAMPAAPGSNGLRYSFSNSHSEQLELEINPQLLRSPTPPSVVRFLVFRNVGYMGSYSNALQAADSPPNLDAVREVGAVRSGFEVNFEQALADGGATGIFSRVGFTDGGLEPDAFAEADQALSLGGQISGAHWKRKDDIIGVALGVEGISNSHQQYLAEGGQGFALGDGALRYAPEQITEAYYLYQATKTLQVSLDAQLVTNPGYNQDRGPAPVFSVRCRYVF
jgi:high affinity Mn2+ porin